MRSKMYEHFQRENFITPIFYLLEHNPENKYYPPDNDFKRVFLNATENYPLLVSCAV